MKFTIGIDLDNTIACYDKAFSVVAHELGFTDLMIFLTKSQVKELVLARPGGDLDWQRLQGQVYGKYIHLATVFPGFVEFVCRSKLNGHSVFVVSHKSEYGHFDNTRVNLRDAALSWMTQHRIIGSDGTALLKSEIFFASTRREKLYRIRTLECTHFIDDLEEVLADPFFPEWTERILFLPDCSVNFRCDFQVGTSWQMLKTNIFGDDFDDTRPIPQTGITTKSAIEAKNLPPETSQRV